MAADRRDGRSIQTVAEIQKTEETSMYAIKSSAMEFKNHKIYEYTLAGRPLVIETGKLAGSRQSRQQSRRKSFRCPKFS